MKNFKMEIVATKREYKNDLKNEIHLVKIELTTCGSDKIDTLKKELVELKKELVKTTNELLNINISKCVSVHNLIDLKADVKNEMDTLNLTLATTSKLRFVKRAKLKKAVLKLRKKLAKIDLNIENFYSNTCEDVKLFKLAIA